METGEIGLLGHLVVLLVVVEFRIEQENVTFLLPLMEALIVLGHELKVRLATMKNVLSVCIKKFQCQI
jgi:hypothetical protein